MNVVETIELANDRVPILQAFRMVGLDVGDVSAVSMKLYCPFGDVYHHDGGSEKSLRIYPETNSAWCFAGCGYFSPVKLVALKRDLSEEEAAEAMLEETGYVAPNYSDQWDALVNETKLADTTSLAEALKVACSRMTPDWEELQFTSSVSSMLARCLALLAKVRTEEDADKWLATTKTAMRRELTGVSSKGPDHAVAHGVA